MKKLLALIILSIFIVASTTAKIIFKKGSEWNVVVNPSESQVVFTALQILQSDFEKVFTSKLIVKEEGDIQVATLGVNAAIEKLYSKEQILWLKDRKEGFWIKENKGKLYVLGSDKRGTAYGLLELSRMIGVSPWEWWADVKPQIKDKFIIANGFEYKMSPSVAYRGIFLNDEDWGINPWSWKNHDPSDVKGRIGSKTHARIFELLLRLRANTMWPAMHECSEAFFFGPGNKEMADKYGILIGTSHCEPMLRNTNAEWRVVGKGRYDFVNNPQSIVEFWKERVEEQKNSDNIFTLGIRGVHDGKMEGATTLQEQKDALIKVLDTQRKMISTMVNPKLEQVPQVFIPYKEVLDVYKLGLEVPEDVTLMWTDDNYGYIKHFPTPEEAARKGGNGVYYHVSYWGRPHDYLWLATTHPAQIYSQMKTAYDKGARKMWILNVGDIKPAEYLTELFLDMAWNIEGISGSKAGLNQHLEHWLTRELGDKLAKQTLSVMNEYYRLAYIRKPEFMANTRTEEKDPDYKTPKDLPWTKDEMLLRLDQYKTLSDKVLGLSSNIPSNRRSAWFQLVEYPVRAAYEMNKKHLMGTMARQGFSDWSQSDAAHDTIVSLNQKYNSLENGKWNFMMDYKPRQLEVFQALKKVKSEQALPIYSKANFTINGVDYKSYKGFKPISLGLGYNNGAVELAKSASAIYEINAQKSDSVRIQFSMAPNHPVSGETIRISVSLNDESTNELDYTTHGRSEEWKINVLTNQAVRTIYANLVKGKNKILVTAMDEGVVLDQIQIWKE